MPGLMPRPKPMPIKATPIVPIVPQDVPVAREVMEQMRTHAMKKIAGLRTFRP